MSVTLTEELLAKVHRLEEDAGPSPGILYLTDEDFAAIRDRLLATRPRGDAIWVFAYGSLLWNPCFEAVEAREAVLHGWHRRFALWLTRWRGTRAFPGLMLALDRGGSCKGLIYRLAEDDLTGAIDTLLRREIATVPPPYLARWVAVRSAGEPLQALVFVANRAAPAYAGPLAEEKTVEVLSRATGHLGSCADYLRRTVLQLENLKIRDATLWRLQSKVAAHITALPAQWSLPVSTVELRHPCEG